MGISVPDPWFAVFGLPDYPIKHNALAVHVCMYNILRAFI